jgi:sec-independent protein translocase protein TatA
MFRNPTTDLIIALVIVLLIFGPKRLPGLGRQLGHGLREFKESITGESKDSEEAERPELTPGGTAPLPPSEPARTAAGQPARDPAERNS